MEEMRQVRLATATAMQAANQSVEIAAEIVTTIASLPNGAKTRLLIRDFREARWPSWEQATKVLGVGIFGQCFGSPGHNTKPGSLLESKLKNFRVGALRRGIGVTKAQRRILAAILSRGETNLIDQATIGMKDVVHKWNISSQWKELYPPRPSQRPGLELRERGKHLYPKCQHRPWPESLKCWDKRTQFGHFQPQLAVPLTLKSQG